MKKLLLITILAMLMLCSGAWAHEASMLGHEYEPDIQLLPGTSIRCAVYHLPGSCCHYGETMIDAPEVKPVAPIGNLVTTADESMVINTIGVPGGVEIRDMREISVDELDEDAFQCRFCGRWVKAGTWHTCSTSGMEAYEERIERKALIQDIADEVMERILVEEARRENKRVKELLDSLGVPE